MCGGTQVTREIAQECGMDDGFGRGTKGIQVVNSMVKLLKAKKRI
jgi:D-ornithine 4,5-aminomutase subunit beta